ncbi:putative transcriptional regulatory protein [Yarrowia sp. C11]|nr:putative transcriptional regulatory protein [Yarrowia sp. C11]KAG5364326.1 putative transcriptional regulatory protein [Yarrowia sp. E02]
MSPTSPPEKKRKREKVARACKRCKHRKVKCDGKFPCETCIRAGAQCVYLGAEREHMTFQECYHRDEEETRDTSHLIPMPPGPPCSEGIRATHESNHLDEEVTSGQAHVTQPSQINGNIGSTVNVPMPAHTHDHTRHNSAQGSHSGSHHGSHHGSTVGLPNSLGGNNPYMNVPSTILPPIRKTKYTKNFTYYIAPLMAKCIQDGLGKEGAKKIAVPRYQAYGWNMSGIHYLKPRSLASSDPLITEVRLWHLIDVYFKFLNPIFSPLCEGVFRTQLEKFYQTRESREVDPEPATSSRDAAGVRVADPPSDSCDKPEIRLFNALCHIACATAMRYLEVTTNEIFETNLEETLFDDGYKTIQALSFEWQSLDLIQGWLLITFYLRMCHRQSSAWSALGQATRMCMGMYLFEDLQQDEEDLDPFDRQKQERVFWCAYTWDRILSLETGRPFSFRDDAITFQRPTSYQNDGWLSITSYGLLRLAFVISLYSPSKGFRFERQIFEPEKKQIMLNALHTWNEEMKSIGLGFDDDLNRLPGVHASTYAFLRQQYYSVTYIFNVETLLQFSSGGSIRYDGIGSTMGLLGSAHGLLKLSLVMKREKCLISPLWLTLSTLFNTGCVLICFANVGIDWTNLADNLGNIVALVTDLQLSGKFIMADEILWGLKTLNHAVYLRLQRTQQIFRAVGIDHGSQAVNHGRFNRAVLSHQQTVSSPPQDLQKLMNPNGVEGVLFGAAMAGGGGEEEKEPPHNWFGSFNWDDQWV